MAEYLVHKPVDLAKVKAKRRKELEAGELSKYWALAKYDGCCAIIQVCTGRGLDLLDDTAENCIRITSRTGEEVRSMGHIKQELFNRFAGRGVDLVLFAEAWCPGKDFAEISGLFRQHKPAPELRIRPWDAVAGPDYRAGVCTLPFYRRFEWLQAEFGDMVAQCWLPGTFDAKSLAYHLVTTGGYDGLILADPLGQWVKGNGSGGEKIKVKPSLSFDLEVVGTEPGKGKHAGRIGNLVVRYKDGKLLGVGTGLSDADRALPDWIGKIVEVEAMGHSSDGSLREPRLKGVRYDKEQADY